MTPKTYSLSDLPTAAETGGIPFNERYNREVVKAVKTGEFRSPKAGEWYLSGATPEGYKAPNDLTTPFHILKLVRVEVQTVVIEKVLPL